MDQPLIKDVPQSLEQSVPNPSAVVITIPSDPPAPHPFPSELSGFRLVQTVVGIMLVIGIALVIIYFLAFVI